MSGSAMRARRDAVATGAELAAATAPSLAELQAAFQRAIVAGDDDILRLLRDNSRTGREQLFGVYRHAYKARLVDIIGNDYEALAAYLGDDTFRALAELYIDRFPSRSANARWVSHAMPEFIAATPPYAAHPELAELARIERDIGDAFDSADAASISIADLAGIAPESWAQLGFTPHPSVRRLDNATNARAIWGALRDQDEPPTAVALPEPEPLVIWRDGFMPMLHSMPAEEARLWDALSSGARFGELCEALAGSHEPDAAALRAAQYLHAWLVAGLLHSATIES